MYIGVDLGGTNIAVGLVSEEGKIIAQTSTPTLVGRPYQAIVEDMAVCAKKVMEEAQVTVKDVKSVGIGIPGVADQTEGRVIFCTNLGWADIPLRVEMQKYLPLPVYIDNDATVAGLAESYAGISANCSSSVMFTLGTGVGGGIIIDGKPWSGAHGIGSEVGHMTLVFGGEQCTCGKRGCIERYASATAIIRMAKNAVREVPESAILTMAGGDPNKINAKIVMDAAKAGDPTAVNVFDQYTEYLAAAINTVTTFLDPEMIVLGGGVSRAGEFLLNAVRAKLPNYLLFKALPSPRLELARLGNEAGIIGAALLGRAAN